ncbi:MAG: hypothetical protein Fues2KO_47470 [Fuerstiella sp.]
MNPFRERMEFDFERWLQSEAGQEAMHDGILSDASQARYLRARLQTAFVQGATEAVTQWLHDVRNDPRQQQRLRQLVADLVTVLQKTEQVADLVRMAVAQTNPEEGIETDEGF